MGDIYIPPGFHVPLIDKATELLPDDTMAVLDIRYADTEGPAGPPGPAGADGAPGPAGPAGADGPAGPSGQVTYADTAAFDAETLTREGVVTAPATTWGAYTGLAGLNAYSGPAKVETFVNVVAGSTRIVQRLHIAGSFGAQTYYRTKLGAGAYNAWSDSFRVGTPVNASDATTKTYVDAAVVTLGVVWPSLAAFTAHASTNASMGVIGTAGVTAIDDAGTVFGIASLNGLDIDRPTAEHLSSFDDVTNTYRQVQRITFPNLLGDLVTVQRSRSWVFPPGSAGAWSAWTLAGYTDYVVTLTATGLEAQSFTLRRYASGQVAAFGTMTNVTAGAVASATVVAAAGTVPAAVRSATSIRVNATNQSSIVANAILFMADGSIVLGASWGAGVVLSMNGISYVA